MTRLQACKRRLIGLLRSERGDTMVEVLAAILIAALGAAALATMVMGAVNVSTATQAEQARVYRAEEEAAVKSAGASTIDVTAGSKDCSVSVAVFRSTDGTFVRYEEKTDPHPDEGGGK